MVKADTDKVEEHKASLAVWDLPSPIVIGRSARMKVGAKCSADCRLTNHEIEIQDEHGGRTARATLGGEPWPGTTGLYWAEVEFAAPAATGTHTWTVKSPHGDALSSFTFIAVPPPDHTLTIRIREKGTQALLSEAEVRCGVYRATSDDKGLAQIDLPKGTYEFSVWKLGYEHFSTAVNITDNQTVDVEIPVEPEVEQPYWM